VPKQNPLTRLEAVAAGLGHMAEELQDIYGEPTPNLQYWRNEIIEVIDELSAGTTPTRPAAEPRV
jgi:hypothetical protein